MRNTDVTIQDADVSFDDITLTHPFSISGGTITEFTLATVTVTVVDRLGNAAKGSGASIFSIPWSWPGSTHDVASRDSALRALIQLLLNEVKTVPFSDPIEIWSHLFEAVDSMAASVADEAIGPERIPHLAAMLTLGAVDNAVHDGWARAAGRSAYTMYTPEYLNQDLAELLGQEFAGRYPGDFIHQPRRTLPIQHLSSPSDPILRSETRSGETSLVDWIICDQPRHLKVKILGEDVLRDARRIVGVYEVAREHLHSSHRLTLAIDPNEAYSAPSDVIGLLDAISARSPEAADALTYIEQPISRDAPVDSQQMRILARRIPVVMDEGLTSLQTLRDLSVSGWSGAVIKAGKGQTLALLTYAFSKHHRLFVILQDLTAVGLALQHSGRLASVLDLSSPHFEYNSRQYAPDSNRHLDKAHPELVRVVDGHVTVNHPHGAGIH